MSLPFENRFFFRPTRQMLDTPADHGIAYEDVWARTDDGLRIHGWFMKPAGEPRSFMLFSHGMMGNMSGEPVSARPLVARGHAVLNYDYRGYGRSEGQPTEQGTYLDGEAMLAQLLARSGGPGRVFLYGRSLGGGISHELALRHPELAGLITDCSFTSLPAMVRHYSWVPAIWRLTRTRYDNLSKASRIRLPRLVLHGECDEVVPLWMAEALRDATDPPAEFLWVRGGGHNDTTDRQEYQDAIARFVDQHSRS